MKRSAGSPPIVQAFRRLVFPLCRRSILTVASLPGNGPLQAPHATTMNRRQSLAMLSGAAIGIPPSRGRQAARGISRSGERITPENLLLKDYRPRSIYRIPEIRIAKAKHPVIDCHTHPYARTPSEVGQWVRNMDAVGQEKGVVLTMASGEKLDEIWKRFSGHRDRFELWCGFDLTRFDSAGFERRALEALERCHGLGATGVGELVDKERGIGAPIGTEAASWGIRPTGSRPIPAIPSSTPFSTNADSWGCPSAFMSPTHRGRTSRWTRQTTG